MRMSAQSIEGRYYKCVMLGLADCLLKGSPQCIEGRYYKCVMLGLADCLLKVAINVC